jgi:predicted RNA-binding protein with PUA-like domain
MRYWLMKSEPSVYSIEDLRRDQHTIWDGVRNYQARNFLKSMAIGDVVFFYHSNTKPPEIVGLMQVSQTGVTDPSQFDPHSDYYDPKSTPDRPRWQTVEVCFQQSYAPGISLDELKERFTETELLVVRKGNRLSVLPVEETIAQRLLEQLTLKNIHP